VVKIATFANPQTASHPHGQMKPNGIKFEFVAEVWKYSGPASWYFISMPQKMSANIRSQLKFQEEGWGRMKAQAKIGMTEWTTAIWFDTKSNAYLLPLKADIRKKEKLESGSKTKVYVWI
jgi:hypothetical protein